MTKATKSAAYLDRFGCSDDYARHVEGKTILAIVADCAYPHLPDEASFHTIDFYVDGYRLALSTDGDTDEMNVAVVPAPELPNIQKTHPILDALVSRTFGWFWSAVNSQGYNDILILAFDGRDGEIGAGITPQLVFLVEASAIHIHQISSVSA